MDNREYQRMRQYEDEYWWYHGLRSLTVAMIARYCVRPRPLLLDAGCGTGGQLAWLCKHLPYVVLAGIDLVPEAVESTQQRGFRNLARASVMRLPFPDDAFDIVTSMDVLYIQGVDDIAALREMRRIVRPGGLLLLNLPAFEFLRGAHDVAIRTRHRYRRSEVRALLAETGYHIELLSYWNMTLLGGCRGPVVERLPPHGSHFRFSPHSGQGVSGSQVAHPRRSEHPAVVLSSRGRIHLCSGAKGRRMNITLEGISRLWGGWGILIFSTLTGVVAQLALKHAVSARSLFPSSGKILDAIPALISTWQLWVYGFFAVASLVSWLLVVSQFDLSMAFPVVQSLSYLLIVISSVFLFRETVTLTNMAGLGLLCVGVFLVSQ